MAHWGDNPDAEIDQLGLEHYHSDDPDNRVVFEDNFGNITLEEKGKKSSKQFNFYVVDQHGQERDFWCGYLKSYRCRGRTKGDGPRCKRRCVIGTEFCFHHLKSIKRLRIDRTRLRDPATGRRFNFKGVFAVGFSRPHDPREIVFRPNDTIITYDGDYVKTREMNIRYADKTAPYAMEDSTNLGNLNLGIVDAALARSVGALVNYGDRNQRNAALGKIKLSYKSYTDRGREITRTYECLGVKALKCIHAGEEILADYGNRYILNENTKHETVPAKRGIYSGARLRAADLELYKNILTYGYPGYFNCY